MACRCGEARNLPLTLHRSRHLLVPVCPGATPPEQRWPQHAVADGARPPAVIDRGLGDWPHGWQHSASRTRNLHFRDPLRLSGACPPNMQSRPFWGVWIAISQGVGQDARRVIQTFA